MYASDRLQRSDAYTMERLVSGIYFTDIAISNFKCFQHQRFAFGVPDGSTPGSGLNVLIGENGNGKTAVLEALNYCSQSSFAVENRLGVHDFLDFKVPIEFEVGTTLFTVKIPFPTNGTFDCDGLLFKAKNRDRKSPGRLLSSPFQVTSKFSPTSKTYRKQGGDDSGKPIPTQYLAFSNANLQNTELNVFFFDKNRTRQLSIGNFKTTFERICDDLNWKYLKQLDEDNEDQILTSITGEFFETVLSIAQKGTGTKLSNELKEFFGQEEFADLGIDLVDLLHPFKNSFFSVRKEGEFTQIAPRSLGSGVEIILTLLLLRSISGESKGGIVYLIDEPELHLHPKAQEKLVELLMEESSDKQIVMSTHSPYIVKRCMSEAVQKIILRRDEDNQIDVDISNDTNWGTFPWSPSWGEVNYAAYNLPTIEYHNELYGWLQENHELNSPREVDSFLSSLGVALDRHWVEVRTGKANSEYAVTLCTYVRHSIHHPENQQNPTFSEDELRTSIETLLNALN